MIALDENMVGIDDDIVIVQGLMSCLALFCKTGNNQIIGAHFTAEDSLDDMKLILVHIRNAANNMTWMAMVTKFNYWATSPSTMTTKEKLGGFFRGQLHCAIPLNYIDFQNAATRYDIKCTNGITPELSYRPTPDPNPTTLTPSGNVFQLRKAQNTLVATNAGVPGMMHCVPQNTTGFMKLSSNIEDI